MLMDHEKPYDVIVDTAHNVLENNLKFLLVNSNGDGYAAEHTATIINVNEQCMKVIETYGRKHSVVAKKIRDGKRDSKK